LLRGGERGPSPTASEGGERRPSSPSLGGAERRRLWTTLDLIRWTKDFFERKGLPSPRLEAELLLAEVLGCERIRLYVDFQKPVGAEALARFREWVRRRGEGREPFQYIAGRAQFLDLKLRVTPAVLIPRPETEELAQWAIAAAREIPGETLHALDLCTGSGCLALALAAHEPRARVTAADCSAAALAIARENAAAVGLSERVTLIEGDLFAPLPETGRGAFDLLIANPPYVAPELKDTLAPEVRDHEPPEALFAGEGGLSVLRRIGSAAGEWLKPGGRLGLEISPEQSGPVRELLEAAGAFRDITIRADARKCDRFALAVRK